MFCIHILYYARQKCGAFGVGFDGEKHVDPQFLFRLICLAAVLLHEGPPVPIHPWVALV